MVAVSGSNESLQDPRGESPPDSPDQDWSMFCVSSLPEDFDIDRWFSRLTIPRNMIYLAERNEYRPSQVVIKVATSYHSLMCEEELQRAHLYWDIEVNDSYLHQYTC